MCRKNFQQEKSRYTRVIYHSELKNQVRIAEVNAEYNHAVKPLKIDLCDYDPIFRTKCGRTWKNKKQNRRTRQRHRQKPSRVLADILNTTTTTRKALTDSILIPVQPIKEQTEKGNTKDSE